jgi:hypothetical protein
MGLTPIFPIDFPHFLGGGASHGSDPYLPLFPGEFQTHRNLSQAVPCTCLAMDCHLSYVSSKCS